MNWCIEVDAAEVPDIGITNLHVRSVVVVKDGVPLVTEKETPGRPVTALVADLENTVGEARAGPFLDLLPDAVRVERPEILRPASFVPDVRRRLEGEHVEAHRPAACDDSGNLIHIARGDGHVVREIEAHTVLPSEPPEHVAERTAIGVQVCLVVCA